MIVSGMDCPQQATIEEVALRTIECLKETVSHEVPGCAFLSGGQSKESATAHLNAMNVLHRDNLPWNLTFSYGRALQESAIKLWAKNPESVHDAQHVFLQRAKYNGMASTGNYSQDLEMVTE